MKKLKLLTILSLTMLFTQVPTSSILAAQTSETTSQTQSSVNKDYSNVKKYAQKFFNNQVSKGTLSNPIELYNLSDTVQALYFSSDAGGYLIVDLSDYSITEFSKEGTNDYINDRNKKHLYNGPLSYLEESINGQVIDSKTKKSLGNLNDLKKYDIFKKKGKVRKSNSVVNDIPETSDLALGYSGATTTTYYNIKKADGSRPLYNHKITFANACTPTAAVILLRYYDEHYNSSFVNDMDLFTDYNVLVKKFMASEYMCTNLPSTQYPTEKKPLTDGTYFGTFYKDATYGLQKYIVKDQKVNCTIEYNGDGQYPQAVNGATEYYSFDPSIAKSLISSNNPYLADLQDGWTEGSSTETYGPHTVTVYGYSTVKYNNYPAYYGYAQAVDGYGLASAWINALYIDDMIYIDHSYTYHD
ncbi:hypothetical protein P8V03_02915 [Clostridium sp. A1-XYC3]|uniref:Peptidase C39-like domain-containing protein n=1 Tax=Clostridium tanneri TaxID=3037988 RepID=A0ABU4JPN0_9CLOT|nr:hypothetical protein [Clostridium sp. A1-XYC3]MDW8800104.1 hypothetical protein [Clostridium sp. A1-XYC3]